ncbi:DNA methylase N-4/N-6 [Guptibacillus spartinae]|uniref:DNA methylase N-4/N-6 n=1 Tax=Guptibacillus spartinae TaxID=3025679 RepID=UPI0023606B52|nr:DNA methylase N-4/N-6 [Pseudalkalibacillus spartinae]
MNSSIMNFPNRGKYGNNRYPGNCSGYVILELLKHYQPKKFVEVFAGGGTGVDVAQSLGMDNSLHLDLNPKYGGWNALKDDMPVGSDFVFSHPAYHDIIAYSGNAWGNEPHPDDLSRCASYEEFVKKLDHINAKIYSSLRNGGKHAILVGDVRRKGDYFSIIKDMNWIGKVESHIIKTQHNTSTANKSYGNNKLIRIDHEHLLVFKKNDVWSIPVAVTRKVEQNMKDSTLPSWRDIVQTAMEDLGGKANLHELYHVIGDTKKAKKNQHWQAKVRQTLQLSDEFHPIRRGFWGLTFSKNIKTAI